MPSRLKFQQIYAPAFDGKSFVAAAGFCDNQDRRQGEWTSYYTPGALIDDSLYASKGGAKALLTYRDGKRHGPARFFYDEPVKLRKPWDVGPEAAPRPLVTGHFKNDLEDGVFTTYNDKGDATRHVTYVQGRRHGEASEYLEQIGWTYGVYLNHMREGAWRDAHGNVVACYANGVAVSEKSYQRQERNKTRQPTWLEKISRRLGESFAENGRDVLGYIRHPHLRPVNQLYAYSRRWLQPILDKIHL